MTKYGYHASHEQFPPDELVRLVERAEARGFTGALASDHFQPLSERQGEAGFVWPWLGGMADLGVDRAFVHNVNWEQFVDDFGQDVLPALE